MTINPKSFRLGSRERASASVDLALKDRLARTKLDRSEIRLPKKLRAPIANEPFNRAAYAAGMDDGFECRTFGTGMHGMRIGMRSYMAGFKHGKWMRDHEF